MAIRKKNTPEERRKFILSKGYDSIRDFSKKSGIKEAYLSRTINGSRYPTMPFLFELATALRTPVEVIAALWWHDEIADINRSISKRYFNNAKGDKLIRINNKFYRVYENKAENKEDKDNEE